MTGNFHRDGCDCRTDTKHPNPKKIIFECDRDPQEAVFEILEPVAVCFTENSSQNGDSVNQLNCDCVNINDLPDTQRLVENFPLTNVLIDARRLVRPIVFLEFSSQIFFKVTTERCNSVPEPASLFRIRLKFILTRKCDNGPEESIRTWEYEKSFTLVDEVGNVINDRTISVPFSVVHCESLILCDCDCCEYAVTVTATSTSEPIFEEILNNNNGGNGSRNNDGEFVLFTSSDFINIEEARVTKTSMSGFALQECTDCCTVRKC